jgi:hypothetical protein
MQRYSRVRTYSANHVFNLPEEAVRRLLDAAPDGSVNVRSFTPENPKSREFIYGLRKVDDVTAALRRLADQGLYTIVNETINVRDGGVSGVAFGNIIEFAPGDTPRCVEKPGTAALSRLIGLSILETVYGFHPALGFAPDFRIEFSIHPLRRGFRYEHTIIWELEKGDPAGLTADIRWPNLFSQFLGDKAFGLLIAYALDLKVPKTIVIPRHLAPFTFGEPTGTRETWIRTCPAEQVPGRYTTQRGWTDPYRLLYQEDPEGTVLASILAQEGVDAVFSGALITNKEGNPVIEGVRGQGDQFMLGQARDPLPTEVEASVRQLHAQVSARFGPIRFEWVYDGTLVWIVQLHRGATESYGRTIYPGRAPTYHRFMVENGIEALRGSLPESRAVEMALFWSVTWLSRVISGIC